VRTELGLLVIVLLLRLPKEVDFHTREEKRRGSPLKALLMWKKELTTVSSWMFGFVGIYFLLVSRAQSPIRFGSSLSLQMLCLSSNISFSLHIVPPQQSEFLDSFLHTLLYEVSKGKKRAFDS
jgi:hypothetical protein